MKKQNIEEGIGSRVDWDNLEGWARGRIQEVLQDVPEEEVAELLGRLKSVRRKPVDEVGGYRNGYGQPSKLTMGCGYSLSNGWDALYLTDCDNNFITMATMDSYGLFMENSSFKPSPTFMFHMPTEQGFRSRIPPFRKIQPAMCSAMSPSWTPPMASRSKARNRRSLMSARSSTTAWGFRSTAPTTCLSA